MQLNAIPREIWMEILSYLSFKELKEFILVSRFCKEIGEDPILWKSICLKISYSNKRNIIEAVKLPRLSLVTKVSIVSKNALNSEVISSLENLKLERVTLNSSSYSYNLYSDSDSDCSSDSESDSYIDNDYEFYISPNDMNFFSRISFVDIEGCNLSKHLIEEFFSCLTTKESRVEYLSIGRVKLSGIEPETFAKALAKIKHVVIITREPRYKIKKIQTYHLFEALNSSDSKLEKLEIMTNADLSHIESEKLVNAVTRMKMARIENCNLQACQVSALCIALAEDAGDLEDLGLSYNIEVSEVPPLVLGKAFRKITSVIIQSCFWRDPDKISAFLEVLQEDVGNMKELDLGLTSSLQYNDDVPSSLICQVLRQLVTVSINNVWEDIFENPRKILEEINRNPGKLENLNIAHNSLSRIDVKLLVNSFRKFKTIDALGCKLTPFQVCALIKALNNNSGKLKTLKLGNQLEELSKEEQEFIKPALAALKSKVKVI